MASIVLLYGDESQLIEERKFSLLSKYADKPIQTLSDEHRPSQIAARLSENSLFGEQEVFCLVNLPIFPKKGKPVKAGWTELQNLLLNYDGANPVLLVYHDSIDKSLKINKELLAAFHSEEFRRLEGAELLKWIQNYCQSNGYSISRDGMAYLHDVLEIWQDVPVTFMRTEFDRFFLLLDKKATIDANFLQTHSSDYGAKNIFTFKEALFDKNISRLLELFPFILSPKERDRAFSYIEGQLRLQLMVNELAEAGMSEGAIQDLFRKEESKTKSYPIKLAYGAVKRINTQALRALLRGLYEVVSANRLGNGDLERFQDICISYCGRD